MAESALGVSYDDLTPALAQQYNVRDESGALTTYGILVTEVDPYSAADLYGVQVHDAILSVSTSTAGGQAPNAGLPLANIITAYKPGDTVFLTISRNGKLMQLQVTLGIKP